MCLITINTITKRYKLQLILLYRGYFIFINNCLFICKYLIKIRLYHPTSFDHAYVTSDHEREVFIAKGYVSEGIAGFGSLSLTP